MIHQLTEAPAEVRLATDRLLTKANQALKTISNAVHGRYSDVVNLDVVELEYAIGKLIEIQNKITR